MPIILADVLLFGPGLAQYMFGFLGYLFGGRLLDRLGGICFLRIVFVTNSVATRGWIVAAGLHRCGTHNRWRGPERILSYWAITSIVSGFRSLFGPLIGSFLVKIDWPSGRFFF